MDLHNSIKAVVSIAPVSEAANTAVVGSVVDSTGFSTVEHIIITGSLADADATFTVLLEEGLESDMSDAAEVADKHMLGTEAAASFTFADDSTTRKLGYTGDMPYTRLTITPVGNASAALVSAVALLGTPRNAPVA